MQKRRSRLIWTMIVSSVLVFLIGLTTSTTDTASAVTYSINKTQSGLVTSDSLTSGNTASLSFGGTAATHDYFEDSQGLHIGVRSPQSGQWVNYYAGLPHPNASLFHTTITIPDTSVPDGVSNVGLYVEGSDSIPHVGCEAYADSTGYYWDVEQSSDGGVTYKILYTSQPSSLPQTQDCTIITNGNNYLKVYIGTNLVFSSSSMNLGMSAPFIAFVQDDTSSSNKMHYGVYSNYYITAGENIKVTNNPTSAATVKLVDSSGQVFASSPVSSGTATLNVGAYHLPLSANINVYDSSNAVIASSSASIYGGDVYSVTSSASTPAVPTMLGATVTSSSQINLSWNAPTDNGGSPITGYKIERSTDNGSTWSVIQPNTATTATTYSDTGLSPSTAYTYRVSAINSAGTSAPSNTASAITAAVITTSKLTVSTQDLNGAPISGLFIELWQKGAIVNSGYSPVIFTVNNNQQYTVMAAGYQNYVFDHWDDKTTGAKTITVTQDTSLIAYYQTGTTIHAITRTQSGLIISDPLNNETKTQQQLQSSPRYWVFGGDAPDRNAPYDFFKDTQGSHIGVQAPANGSWAGFYASSPNSNAILYHAIITTPVGAIQAQNQYYENGMYIQTAQPFVNYVTCSSVTGSFGTVWAIVSSLGNSTQGNQFTTLWYDTSPNQPLTRDCTIITNGTNYLKVYMDGKVVYENRTLNLQMPPPFNTYLEPQTSYAGQMLTGGYLDYYTASNENIKITNLPSNSARVDIVDNSGNVITSVPVSSSTVVIDVGKYHFPLVSQIKVYDFANSLVASSSNLDMYGGDTYSVN